MRKGLRTWKNQKFILPTSGKVRRGTSTQIKETSEEGRNLRN